MTTSEKEALGLSGQGNVLISPSLKSVIPSTHNIQSVVSPNYDFDEGIPDDLKQWYPMRIAHGNPKRTTEIRDFLCEHHVENFLPMTWKLEYHDGKSRRVLVPAIDNLIFIRSVEECITHMKRSCKNLLPLRYIMWHPQDLDYPVILHVPDRQMKNFMRVASVEDDSVMFLGNKDFSGKIGKRVRIVGGPFEGVVGTIYRVKKDRRVVVTLDNISSVAISHINPSLLEVIAG